MRDDRSAVLGKLGGRSTRRPTTPGRSSWAGDSTLVLPAAEKLARAGRRDRAARLLAGCGRRGPLDPDLARAWALACLFAGDRAGYLEARAAVVARDASAPNLASLVLDSASILSLGPAGPDDPGPLSASIESNRSSLDSTRNFDFHPYSTALGGLYLRAGRLDEAIARLGEGIAADGGQGTPIDRAFLAMAHARKGDLAEARRHLDRL